jgi:hypothetical protein
MFFVFNAVSLVTFKIVISNIDFVMIYKDKEEPRGIGTVNYSVMYSIKSALKIIASLDNWIKFDSDIFDIA